MLESLNYSFRNRKKNNLSNLLHQTVEKLQKNRGVLRGPQFGKQCRRARLGILRVKGSKVWFLRIITNSTSLNLFKNQTMEMESSIGKLSTKWA